MQEGRIVVEICLVGIRTYINVFGIFSLPEAGVKQVTVVPRGLDSSRNYHVAFDNTGDKMLVSGRELVTNGLKTRHIN